MKNKFIASILAASLLVGSIGCKKFLNINQDQWRSVRSLYAQFHVYSISIAKNGCLTDKIKYLILID